MLQFMAASQSLLARLQRFAQAGLWLGGCDEILVANQPDMFENRETVLRDEFRGLMVAPFYSGKGPLPNLSYLLNQSKPHKDEEPHIHTLYGATGDLINPRSKNAILIVTLRHGVRGRDGMVVAINPSKGFYKNIRPDFTKYEVRNIFTSQLSEGIDELKLALGGYLAKYNICL